MTLTADGSTVTINNDEEFDDLFETCYDFEDCDLEDFECFSKVKTEVNNFNCQMFEAKWTREDDQLLFSVRANRFLRGMVRALVGTLLEVGQGKMTVAEFQQVLESRDRKKAGRSVPADGLYLNEVNYPASVFDVKK